MLWTWHQSLCAQTTATPSAQTHNNASTTTDPRRNAPIDGQRDELVGIKQEIGVEQQRLNQALRERQYLDEQVQQAERAGTVVLRRLRQLKQRHETKNKELKALRKQVASQTYTAEQLKEKLGFQVRADFIIGRQDYMKLILNQEDPARVSRAVAYHSYVVRARAQRLQALTTKVQHLQTLEQTITEQRDKLTRLHQQSLVAHREFEIQRTKRSRALAELRNRIFDSDQRLKTLKHSATQLETVLAQLATTKRKLPNASELAAGVTEPEPFATLRGRLPWPATGTLTHTSGHQGDLAGARWHGVRLSARAGTLIHAIAAGRIAYADWLRGFGLLLIVDHGDGYMSLYGHLLEMLVEPGEWVQAGNRLGTVGDSGGQLKSGLYFEIRRRGRPEDPIAWCKGRPSKPA